MLPHPVAQQPSAIGELASPASSFFSNSELYGPFILHPPNHVFTFGVYLA
jgi:hypothetical protein